MSFSPARNYFRPAALILSELSGTADDSGTLNPRRTRFAMKKIALAVLLSLCMVPVASMAQVGVVVRIGPPAPVVEHYGPPPHPGWVWCSGYQRWDGHRYVWVHGYWAHPPRPGAVWVPHHWAHRHGGWVLVEGHWRYR